MRDYDLRVRIPKELANDVRGIVEVLNKEVPEAKVTMSTVCRHALKKYTEEYISKRTERL